MTMTTEGEDDDPCDDWTDQGRPLSQVLQESTDSSECADQRPARGKSKPDILSKELAKKERQ